MHMDSETWTSPRQQHTNIHTSATHPLTSSTPQRVSFSLTATDWWAWRGVQQLIIGGVAVSSEVRGHILDEKSLIEVGGLGHHLWDWLSERCAKTYGIKI